MNENWNNHQRMVNGWVRPPIVLRGKVEQTIAQNAHNLIWDNHWDECTALDEEIRAAERAGADTHDPKARRGAVFAAVKREIDEFIKTEIAAYRKERKKSEGSFEERLDELESELDSLRGGLDDVREIAEAAQSTAEETQEAVETLRKEIEDEEDDDE